LFTVKLTAELQFVGGIEVTHLANAVLEW